MTFSAALLTLYWSKYSTEQDTVAKMSFPHWEAELNLIDKVSSTDIHNNKKLKLYKT